MPLIQKGKRKWKNYFLPGKMNWLFIPLVFTFVITSANGQTPNSFITHGEAIKKATCSEVLITQDPSLFCTVYSKGSAWYHKPIDISQPFQLGFIVDIYDSMGSSGMAFVLQPDTSAIGDFSNSLGWGNTTHSSSIALTFDLKRDSIDTDPDYAHAAIQLRGDTKHNSANNIAGPVNLLPYFTAGMKFYHLIEVAWDPVTSIFSVLLDGNPLLSAKYDLLNALFNGNKKMYWGFTGAMAQLKSLLNQVPPPLGFECPDMGYIRAYFGMVVPRFASDPILDTCFGPPIRFYDNSIYLTDTVFQNAQTEKWFWDFGDGSVSIDQNPLPHVYSNAGKYNIKFAVTNKLGCTLDTVVKQITLASRPMANFTNDMYCINSITHFNDLSSTSIGTIVLWDWYVNNQLFSIDNNPRYTFTSPGPQQVRLHIRSFEGCEADTVKILDVKNKPSVDFSFTAFCDGKILFESNLSADTSIRQLQWDFGDGTRGFVPALYHSYAKSGTYRASLFAVNTSGCVSDTIRQQVVYNTLHAFAGRDTIAARGQPVQLLATGGKQYEWIPATGLSNALIPNPVAIIFTNTQYTVFVRNDDSCFAKATVNLKVYDRPDVYMPNAFTPNHDKLNDVLRPIAPGISINMFKIYNRMGKEVFSSRNIVAGWDGTYQGKDAPAGTYVWIIEGIDYLGKHFTKKGVSILIR